MRLKCYKIKRLLNMFVDNELFDERVLNTLEKHLHDCSSCKEALDSLRMLKGLVSEKEKIVAGEEFLRKLRERLKPESQIVRLKWVTDMGVLSKRLISVPIVVMILMVSLLFSRIDTITTTEDDIFATLTNMDMTLIDIYFDSSSILGIRGD